MDWGVRYCHEGKSAGEEYVTVHERSITSCLCIMPSRFTDCLPSSACRREMMAFSEHISCADNNHLVSDEPGARSDFRNLGSWGGQPPSSDECGWQAPHHPSHTLHATRLIEPTSRKKSRGLCRLSPTTLHRIPLRRSLCHCASTPHKLLKSSVS